MRKNRKDRIAWVVPLLAVGALVIAVPHAYGWAGSQQTAWPGQPVTALSSWPSGVLELVNDSLRTEGWNPFFSNLANDLNHYVMKVRNSDDANRLITKFTAIKADKAQIRLNPGKEPVIEFTAVSEAEKGPSVFSVGNQAIIDQWFQRLPEAEPGVRTFGVHRYSEPPVARPPTLTFYVGHEAIDLKKLNIPASVGVVADITASDRAKSKDDLLLKAIDDFVNRHQAKRSGPDEKSPGYDVDHPKPGAPIDAEKLRRLAWGPPATNGLRAACYFEPTKEAYLDGEVVKRWVVFHNSGKEPVFFTVSLGGNDDGWTAVDEQGQKVPLHHVTYWGLVPLATFRLEPGHATEIECMSTGMGASAKAGGGLTDTEILAKPGTTCRLRWTLCVVETTRKEKGNSVTIASDWHGTLTTGEVRFRIVEKGAAAK